MRITLDPTCVANATFGTEYAFRACQSRISAAQTGASRSGRRWRDRMDAERFDELTASLAEEGTSRRSVLQRLGGGGLAAALAAFGIGGLDVEDAEAKNCRRRCRNRNTARKRRRCLRRCRRVSAQTCAPPCTGTQICAGTTCINPPTACTGTGQGTCSGGFLCVGGICLLSNCTGTGQGSCASGFLCIGGVCVLDDVDCTGSGQGDCPNGLVCIDDICLLDDECEENNDCDLLEVCLLGLCIDL